jgi:hypothetical protein
MDPDFHFYFSVYRQDKAAVLKATIDYIKELRREHDRFGMIEERLRQTVMQYRMMLMRVQVTIFFYLFISSCGFGNHHI